jgi:phosphate transport system permease protein
MRIVSYATWRRWKSRTAYAMCILFTAAILGVLAAVTAYLLSKGLSSLTWELFTAVPTGRADADAGGMKHALVGTAILIGLASLGAIPVGLLTGVYLSEYSAGSRLASPVRFLCDVLSGVPSIVVGVVGYELIVVPMGHFSGWAGALALAFIMIPLVARTTEEMLRLVPDSYREASLALGATRARTILQVVIPAATGSLITGVMLALARVAGETAPLLFTALGSRLLTLDPSQPFPSVTVQAFVYATGPYEPQRKLAWGSILVLIALILGLNLLMRLAGRQKEVSPS